MQFLALKLIIFGGHESGPFALLIKTINAGGRNAWPPAHFELMSFIDSAPET